MYEKERARGRNYFQVNQQEVIFDFLQGWGIFFNGYENACKLISFFEKESRLRPFM